MARKSQVSFYVRDSSVKRLDRWLRYQKRKRDYETDRSHVIDVLLDRFLDANPIPDDFEEDEDLKAVG